MTETINHRIRRFRLQNKYTQRELGELLGLKCSTYSQMERVGKINSDIIIKLCEIFDTDALTLLYGENYLTNRYPYLNEIK